MAFLDWMKPKSNAPQPESHNAELHAEWRQDAQMKALRDTTGKEPHCAPLNVPREPKSDAPKRLPRRERIKSHDIPF